MTKRLVKVYPRFERLWHWTQMLLIFILLFTGLGLNGAHTLIPFGPAVMLHTLTALVLMAVWVFAIFWFVTTGNWRQFVPRFDGLFKVARFYAWGVFRGEEHPYRKMLWRKHNPLQVLTYFMMKVVVFPAIWITGLLYLTYSMWEPLANSGAVLTLVANLHVLVAYVILSFIIVHVYLLTVGHGFRAHLRPMIRGFDHIDLTPEQEAYLEANEPWRLKSS